MREDNSQDFNISAKVKLSIKTRAECREFGSCPLVKKEKATQNLQPKNLINQIHIQYVHTNSLSRSFQTCRVQI